VNVRELNSLLDYHYWARDRMLEALEPLAPDQFTRNMGNSFGSIRDTAAHIYGAEWVWYSRWLGQSPTSRPSADIFSNVATLRTAWIDHEAKMRAFLSDLDDAGINRIIEYTLMDGQPGASVLWHMAQHIVNHASYHRGQITTMLRQLGAPAPKSMDLIAFYRLQAG
jgi:uncharacterized damage-inducible protein DinB